MTMRGSSTDKSLSSNGRASRSRWLASCTRSLRPLYTSGFSQRAVSTRPTAPNSSPTFSPLKMGSEELRDGYLRVLTELSDPENYFTRAEALFLRPDFDIGCVKALPDYWRRHQLRYFLNQSTMLLAAIGLFLRLMNRIESTALRREYRKRLWRFLKVHRRPGLTLFYMFHMVMHYHVCTMARTMVNGEARLINTF